MILLTNWLFDYPWIVYAHTLIHVICHLFFHQRDQIIEPLQCLIDSASQTGDGSYTFRLVCQMQLNANGCVMLWIAVSKDTEVVSGINAKQFCCGCGRGKCGLYTLMICLLYSNTWEQEMFPNSKSPPSQSFGPLGPQWCHSAQRSRTVWPIQWQLSKVFSELVRHACFVSPNGWCWK